MASEHDHKGTNEIHLRIHRSYLSVVGEHSQKLIEWGVMVEADGPAVYKLLAADLLEAAAVLQAKLDNPDPPETDPMKRLFMHLFGLEED
jgi:hypothetical protein